MPQQNTHTASTEAPTGTTALPLARVKKIIAQDDDIAQCSTTAAFSIAIATEIFIHYLTEQAHNVAKSDRKPRRNIAYKDVAAAVARIDNLEFLSDTVPKTKTYRQFREEKAEEAARAAAEAAGNPGTSIAIEPGAMYNGTITDQPNGANGVNGHGTFTEPTNAHRSTNQRPHGHPDPIRDIVMAD
ncbi:hypothetical protein PV10_04710 [Exophiala mesophila]|uniref:Transcription factor CBF/NF-Y/archaeal histone domain-containing protein n=1 Tax=Exophiala mesophila TaxID=212818 RepID=A0A0D1ZI28_EXOME|nr:uncharacterized protein PV10_04710 [Exophiala mesophila]KIV93499.1 hypothetical protein PV10_04710 [Exophiala mesophila]